MLGLKLNHVSKRGHWSLEMFRFRITEGSVLNSTFSVQLTSLKKKPDRQRFIKFPAFVIAKYVDEIVCTDAIS